MQIEKYTDRLKSLIQAAQSLALRKGHQQFTPLHLLKALLDDEDRLASNLIEACGGVPSQLAAAVERELDKLPSVEGSGAGQIYMAPDTARLFDQAEKMAQQAGDSFVTIGNVSGSGAVTIRYSSGGSPTDLSVARSASQDLVAAKLAPEAQAIDAHAPVLDGWHAGVKLGRL